MTLQETNPWLIVDLGKETFVYKISLKNTHSTGGVAVSVRTKVARAGFPCCNDQQQDSQKRRTCMCDVPQRGGFVKLEQMRQAAVLMICDVRVFASGETNDNNNSNNNNNKIKIQQTQSVTRFFMKNHSFYIT